MNNLHKLTIDNNLPVSHLQFFPSIAELILFEKLRKVSIDVYENFQKQTFRNRCIVLSSQGLINITVPVQRNKNEKILLKDAKISYNENWNVWTWRTIFSCYGKSPFFLYYADKVKEILNTKFEYLMDLNIETFFFIKHTMNLEQEIFLTSEFITRKENNYRDMFLTKNRVSDGKKQEAYYQCFSSKFEFQTNLSALDLLFNLGPESETYVKNAVQHSFL